MEVTNMTAFAITFLICATIVIIVAILKGGVEK